VHRIGPVRLDVRILSNMPKSFLARTVALASFALIVALGAFWLLRGLPGPPGPAGSGQAVIGGSFSLTDQFGHPRTDAEFRGKLMLVYFGFTHCPDVCPLDLQKMSQAMAALGPKADQVVPIFITVDPARDTVEVMRDYVRPFDPRLVALTGDKAAIEQVARAYRVYFEPEPAAEGADAGSGDADYGVSHSSIIYLMDRDGRYRAHFGREASVDDIVGAVAKSL
jgi:protein SCO1/2